MAAIRFALRAFVTLLGIGAVAWGVFLLPLFWRQAPLIRVASELLQGHPFERQSLVDEVEKVVFAEPGGFCDPTLLHNAMIVRLAILNESVPTKNVNLIAAAYELSWDATRKALYCSPADAFGWLTLSALDIAKHGFGQDSANYLRMSYATGRNEGWIALWRNRLVMPVFQRLPPDLSQDATEEFISLVNTGGLYAQTAAIFASAAPAVRSRLIAQLKYVRPIHRQLLAQALHDKGVNVNIPGVEQPTLPWQR